MPTGRSPAVRTASTRRSIIDSRAATTTTRVRGLPSASTASPTRWKSSTTSFSGIAIASLAWNRTAASRSLSSSIRGSSSWRTTICWLATPRRTSLGSDAARKMSFRRWPSASESMTSPSRMTPSGRSLEMADWMRPSATVTADRKSPSRSRPTLPRGPELDRALAMEITPGIGHPSSRLEIGPPPLDRRGRAYFALEKVVYINIHELRPGEDPHQPAEREKWAERDALLAGVAALTDDDEDAHERA